MRACGEMVGRTIEGASWNNTVRPLRCVMRKSEPQVRQKRCREALGRWQVVSGGALLARQPFEIPALEIKIRGVPYP